MSFALLKSIQAIEINEAGKAAQIGTIDFPAGHAIEIESQKAASPDGLFHPDSHMIRIERERTGRDPVETVFRAARPDGFHGTAEPGPFRYVTLNLPLL